MQLYKPFKSKAKNKKYSVYVKQNSKTKLIHFGDKRHKHYKDKIGLYSHLDHNNEKKKNLIIVDSDLQMTKILLSIGHIRFCGKKHYIVGVPRLL